jgi:uncharacterized coiled-coil protein SlyX
VALPVWLVIAQALLVLVVPLYLAWNGRRKAPADAAKTITDAAMALVAPLEKRIDALEAETAEQRRVIEEQAQQIIRQADMLAMQAEKLGRNAVELSRQSAQLSQYATATLQKDARVANLESENCRLLARVVDLERQIAVLQASQPTGEG